MPFKHVCGRKGDEEKWFHFYLLLLHLHKMDQASYVCFLFRASEFLCKNHTKLIRFCQPTSNTKFMKALYTRRECESDIGRS